MATRALHVKIVGCGGIGGHLAPNLCHFLHAERRRAHVWVVDGDDYEPRNAARMRFSALENKALGTARDLTAEWGDRLTIEPIPAYVTAANVTQVIGEQDLVFL